MKKSKLFFDNIIIYGIGGVINKIIPIVMLPLVTRLMPDSTYFGINDLHSTIVSFVSAFALMGMYDALYRMVFEKEDPSYQKSMCSSVLLFVIAVAVVSGLFLILLKDHISALIFHDSNYTYLCYIAAFTILADNIRSILQIPTKMQNQRKIFIVTNLLTSIFTYALAIPLIQRGYYVSALPLAGLFSSFLMDIIFWILNCKWFDFHTFRKDYLPLLLKIGVPLMPTFIIFWIFNSCDKLMISNYLGVAANGIYAVGSKLAHASQIISTAFGGGWSYFLYSTMKDKDRVESNSMIFELMAGTIFLCSIGVFVFSKPIYQLFFTGDYVSGYIVSPYLFCAPLIQMLFYVASDQLLIIRKSFPITIMLILGAIGNIILNSLLIPKIGIEGAALATLLGYALSLIVCIFIVQKEKLLKISVKCLFLTVEFITFIFLWKLTMENFAFGVISILIFIISFILLYKNILYSLIKGFFHR